MKKRINTLMYDTDTAKKLGDLWSDYALMISDGGTKHSIKNALANTSCLAKAVQCLNTPSLHIKVVQKM